MANKLRVVASDWEVTGDDLEELLRRSAQERLTQFSPPPVGGKLGEFLRWKFSHAVGETQTTGAR